MLGYLFSVFDVPLACMLIVSAFFGMLLIKDIYNIFLTLFVDIFIIIFIASTMLTQQIYLGEFLVISIFFILTIVFFVFNMNLKFDDSLPTDKKKSKLKLFITALMSVLLIAIVGLNFKKIDNANSKFITGNTLTASPSDSLRVSNENGYDSYVENISLLNQNKIFQRLTHIVMFYVCLVVVLYFFNRRNDSNER